MRSLNKKYYCKGLLHCLESIYITADIDNRQKRNKKGRDQTAEYSRRVYLFYTLNEVLCSIRFYLWIDPNPKVHSEYQHNVHVYCM